MAGNREKQSSMLKIREQEVEIQKWNSDFLCLSQRAVHNCQVTSDHVVPAVNVMGSYILKIFKPNQTQITHKMKKKNKLQTKNLKHSL